MGSLVVASERFPQSGVFIYAIMAAGGDLGAALGPQLVGAIADGISASTAWQTLAQTLSISTEQMGLRVGMLVGGLFPLIASLVFLIHLGFSKGEEAQTPSLLPSYTDGKDA